MDMIKNCQLNKTADIHISQNQDCLINHMKFLRVTLREFHNCKSVLDIGCGAGLFLADFRKGLI